MATYFKDGDSISLKKLRSMLPGWTVVAIRQGHEWLYMVDYKGMFTSVVSRSKTYVEDERGEVARYDTGASSRMPNTVHATRHFIVTTMHPFRQVPLCEWLDYFVLRAG